MKEYSTDERMEICKKCPIYNPLNRTCNSNLWINPDTNEVSTHAKVKYIRGCGCQLVYKTRNRNNHCIAGKW